LNLVKWFDYANIGKIAKNCVCRRIRDIRDNHYFWIIGTYYHFSYRDYSFICWLWYPA